MKSAEIKELSVKELQERIEAQKAQLTKLKVACRIARRGPLDHQEIPQRHRSYADNSATEEP